MPTQKLLFHGSNDLTDTSYRYGVYSECINARKYLITSGSSTTVSELAAGNDSFASFANGDLIHVNVDGTVTTRAVTDATLAPDSVVVSSAVDWQNGTDGRAFSYQRWLNGTAATDGWFDISGYSANAVEIEWVTKNATSLDYSIEGRINGGGAAVLYTQNLTATSKIIVPITELANQIRVGFKLNTDTGVNNVRASWIGEHFGR